MARGETQYLDASAIVKLVIHEDSSRPILVTADKKLAQVAVKEGLRAWDCVHDPLP